MARFMMTLIVLFFALTSVAAQEVEVCSSGRRSMASGFFKNPDHVKFWKFVSADRKREYSGDKNDRSWRKLQPGKYWVENLVAEGPDSGDIPGLADVAAAAKLGCGPVAPVLSTKVAPVVESAPAPEPAVITSSHDSSATQSLQARVQAVSQSLEEANNKIVWLFFGNVLTVSIAVSGLLWFAFRVGSLDPSRAEKLLDRVIERDAELQLKLDEVSGMKERLIRYLEQVPEFITRVQALEKRSVDDGLKALSARVDSMWQSVVNGSEANKALLTATTADLRKQINAVNTRIDSLPKQSSPMGEFVTMEQFKSVMYEADGEVDATNAKLNAVEAELASLRKAVEGMRMSTNVVTMPGPVKAVEVLQNPDDIAARRQSEFTKVMDDLGDGAFPPAQERRSDKRTASASGPKEPQEGEPSPEPKKRRRRVEWRTSRGRWLRHLKSSVVSIFRRRTA